VLSVPFIVMESDLLATLPYAVVTRFVSLTSDVVAALPPFDISYELAAAPDGTGAVSSSVVRRLVFAHSEERP